MPVEIRFAKPEDREDLKEIHSKQGVDYPFPDLDDPLYFSQIVMVKDGKVVMAMLCRLTAEAYFLMDKECDSPLERWKEFLVVARASEIDMHDRCGLRDVHCWVPPNLKNFGHRLKRIGFVQADTWTPFVKGLVGAETDE